MGKRREIPAETWAPEAKTLKPKDIRKRKATKGAREGGNPGENNLVKRPRAKAARQRVGLTQLGGKSGATQSQNKRKLEKAKKDFRRKELLNNGLAPILCWESKDHPNARRGEKSRAAKEVGGTRGGRKRRTATRFQAGRGWKKKKKPHGGKAGVNARQILSWRS